MEYFYNAFKGLLCATILNIAKTEDEVAVDETG